MAKKTILEEIRRVRKELDKRMVKDPGAVHKLAQKAMKKYGIQSVKTTEQDSSPKKKQQA